MLPRPPRAARRGLGLCPCSSLRAAVDAAAALRRSQRLGRLGAAVAHARHARDSLLDALRPVDLLQHSQLARGPGLAARCLWGGQGVGDRHREVVEPRSAPESASPRPSPSSARAHTGIHPLPPPLCCPPHPSAWVSRSCSVWRGRRGTPRRRCSTISSKSSRASSVGAARSSSVTATWRGGGVRAWQVSACGRGRARGLRREGSAAAAATAAGAAAAAATQRRGQGRKHRGVTQSARVPSSSALHSSQSAPGP